jgi:hypothetical protein
VARDAPSLVNTFEELCHSGGGWPRFENVVLAPHDGGFSQTTEQNQFLSRSTISQEISWKFAKAMLVADKRLRERASKMGSMSFASDIFNRR